MKKIICLFYILLLNASCRDSDSQPLQPVSKPETVQASTDENFDEFIRKFFEDKAFRETRITYPVKGYNSEVRTIDSKDEDSVFLWNKIDFEFYSDEDFNPNTRNETEKEIIRSDSSIIYRIYKKDSGYDMRYEFKLQKQKWHLIFYSYKNI